MPKRRKNHNTRTRRKLNDNSCLSKKNGTVKPRGCSDGGSQSEYTTVEDLSSPTMSLEAMIISCAIDSKTGTCHYKHTSHFFTGQHARQNTHVIRVYNFTTNQHVGTTTTQKVKMEKQE